MKTTLYLLALLATVSSKPLLAQHSSFYARTTDEVIVSGPSRTADRFFVGSRTADMIVVKVSTAIDVKSVSYVLESGARETAWSYTPVSGRVTARRPLRLLPANGMPISFVEIKWRLPIESSAKQVRFKVIEMELSRN